MSESQVKCPICHQKKVKITDFPNGQHLKNVECRICGRFEISRISFTALEEKNDRSEFYLLSSYLRNKTDDKNIRIDSDNYLKYIKVAFGIAKGFKNDIDILDGVLLFVYEKMKNDFKNDVQIDYLVDYPIFYLKSAEEFNFFLKLLVTQQNLLSHKGSLQNSRGRYSLTKEGFERVNQLKGKKIGSNKVFIAMAFSDKTKQFREVLKNVISETGYQPIIVDEQPFTGNIVDYILTQIREAKFVISDFTFSPEIIENDKVKNGVRGGVYYEAGFAKGLGLQVIHTCKDDGESIERIHFDTKQENTIFWSDEDLEKTGIRSDSERQKGNSAPQNFSEKLYDRIKFIFGLGKNISE